MRFGSGWNTGWSFWWPGLFIPLAVWSLFWTIPGLALPVRPFDEALRVLDALLDRDYVAPYGLLASDPGCACARDYSLTETGDAWDACRPAFYHCARYGMVLPTDVLLYAAVQLVGGGTIARAAEIKWWTGVLTLWMVDASFVDDWANFSSHSARYKDAVRYCALEMSVKWAVLGVACTMPAMYLFTFFVQCFWYFLLAMYKLALAAVSFVRDILFSFYGWGPPDEAAEDEGPGRGGSDGGGSDGGNPPDGPEDDGRDAIPLERDGSPGWPDDGPGAPRRRGGQYDEAAPDGVEDAGDDARASAMSQVGAEPGSADGVSAVTVRVADDAADSQRLQYASREARRRARRSGHRGLARAVSSGLAMSVAGICGIARYIAAQIRGVAFGAWPRQKTK